MGEMKAISLWQPWAGLVVRGYKRFETRSWKTNHRGWLAIHAGLHKTPRSVWETDPLREALREVGRLYGEFVRGAVIGWVWMSSVHTTDYIRPILEKRNERLELAFGDFNDGRFAWHLGHPYRFEEAIAAKGKQGIWTWEMPDEPPRGVSAGVWESRSSH